MTPPVRKTVREKNGGSLLPWQWLRPRPSRRRCRCRPSRTRQWRASTPAGAPQPRRAPGGSCRRRRRCCGQSVGRWWTTPAAGGGWRCRPPSSPPTPTCSSRLHPPWKWEGACLETDWYGMRREDKVGGEENMGRLDSFHGNRKPTPCFVWASC